MLNIVVTLCSITGDVNNTFCLKTVTDITAECRPKLLKTKVVRRFQSYGLVLLLFRLLFNWPIFPQVIPGKAGSSI